ncbi:MAG: hypothetical protein K0S51_417 [Bacillales bacterium]|nr:hypothetical protein [Bacillales bacterium]
MKGFFSAIESTVIIMACLRVLTALFDLAGAGLMIYFNSVKKALAINGLLATIGPVMLTVAFIIGLSTLTDDFNPTKLGFIFLGIAIILYGVFRN